MTGEFRGYAVSTQQVASTAGDPVPIAMPSDIQAGDFLFVVGGNQALNCLAFTNVIVAGNSVSYMDGPSNWQLLCQAPYIFAKRADGSEAGATLTFVSQDTTAHSGATRPNVHIALCYRFASQPVTTGTALYPDQIYTVYPLKNVSGATPFDTRTQGTYPGFMQAGIEVRIVGFMGAASDTADVLDSFAIGTASWVGTDIADRTGLHSLEGPLFTGALGGTSVTVADVIFLDGSLGFRNEAGGLLLGGHDHASGVFHAIGITFPVTVAYWGINATTPT